jgi:hypothetical protein
MNLVILHTYILQIMILTVQIVQNDNDLLQIRGIKNQNSTILVDLFWTTPYNLNIIPKFSHYRTNLKGIGKRCLCLLFKYFIDFGYITLETIIKLDAAGSDSVTFSSEKNIDYFEKALNFIKK